MDPAELEGAEVQSSVSTYVEVTSSPLVAVIFSGGVSQITIGIGQNLTLDPEALSQDPDDPDKKRVSDNSTSLTLKDRLQ